MRWTSSLSRNAMRALSQELVGQFIGEKWSQKDLMDLMDLEPSYSDWSKDHIIAATMAKAVFSKRDDFELDNLEDKAMETFRSSEQSCSDTNALLRARAEGSVSFTPAVERVFSRARQKISRILGKCPSIAQLDCRYGPGATTTLKRKAADVYAKCSVGLVCSRDLVPVVSELVKAYPPMFGLTPGCGNLSIRVDLAVARLAFVPKTYKALRAIGVEPFMNLFLQLGIGKWMDHRLKRFGIDIHDQSINQQLALEGSLSGLLATIDLSNASDTISYLLVMELLPPDWLCLLDLCRSSVFELPSGELVTLEKYSSMGNGYTFPLETLIFYALAKASAEDSCVDGAVSAYGDDIVVPTGAVAMLLETLKALGFTPNSSKSFWSSPFRESCGHDYYNGENIRPVFLRGTRVCDLYVYHNGLIRAGFVDAASIVRRFVPPYLTLYGPDGFGDGVLISHPMSAVFKPFGRDFGYNGVTFDAFSISTKKRRYRVNHILYPLYLTYTASYSQLDYLTASTLDRSCNGNGLVSVDVSDIEAVDVPYSRVRHYIPFDPRG